MSDGLTREEAKDIYDKINLMSLSIVRIETKLDLMPKPQPRPCETLMEHLKEQKENWLGWKSAIIVGIVSMICGGLSGLFGYWIAGHTERKSDDNGIIKKMDTKPLKNSEFEWLNF